MWLRQERTGPAVVLIALLAGCAAIPRLPPQPATLTPAGVAANQSLAPARGEAVWPAGAWWQAYGDPQLDALVAEGLAASPDVAAAVARLDRASALARQAGAARFPRLDVQGGVQEERQSLNMGFPPEFKAILPQGWNDGGQISASLGFDLDLWGRNRAALAAATSQQKAAALDLQQARLVLSVAIASAYFDLDRLFAERAIRAEQVAAAEKSSQLVEQRRSSGLETAATTAQARAAQAAARVALSQADESLALRQHQIAALVGAGPDRGAALARPALAAVAVRDVPADATTELLSRRPDVIAARERVAAGTSNLKVARADFFPAIRLSALIGFQALGLESLFAQDSQYGQVGPAVSLPIFHGGELAGRYRGARADLDAAVANYNGTVLGAYREAADAVAAARLADQRVSEARAAVAANDEAYRTISARYRAELVTYLDVLQVEDRLLAARLALAGVESGARATDLALVRALGGGFAAGAGVDASNAQ
ncbi:MAG TPA: efflux transporter outer membrane subunit, partial [Novosphingobium sp.]